MGVAPCVCSSRYACLSRSSLKSPSTLTLASPRNRAVAASINLASNSTVRGASRTSLASTKAVSFYPQSSKGERERLVWNKSAQPEIEAPKFSVGRGFRYAATGLALLLWLRLSAGRPGSPFCSTTLAAPSQTGIRNVGASAWAGLAAGCLHSLSGPDHLAALTPLTLGISSVKASLLGAWWGFGHCIGQLILGLLMLLLKDKFHSFLPFLDKYSALTIGLTLITIGGLGLYESFAEGPSQVETSTELPPAMQAAGAAEQLPTAVIPIEPAGTSARELREVAGLNDLEKKSKGFSVWTLATGVVYGLQPDALFVVIPALALPTKLAAAAYMSMFVMGTVMAMGSYTAIIGATSKAMRRRGSWFKVESLSGIASFVALGMGFAVIFGFNCSMPFLGSHAH